MKRSISALLLTAVFSLMASAFAFTSPADAQDGVDELTSRQLVEAVVFGTGPGGDIVNAITDAQPLDGPVYLEVRHQATELLDQIERSNPGAVDVIADGLTSGDPYVVQESLDLLGTELYAATEVLLGTEELDAAMSTLNGSAGYGACSLFLVCTVYMALAAVNTVAATHAAAVTVAAAVAGYAAVFFGQWVWGGLGDDDGSTLKQEAAIADLTLALAG